jgi:replicative DNA helicase
MADDWGREGPEQEQPLTEDEREQADARTAAQDMTARARAAVEARKRPERMPRVGTYRQAKLAAVARTAKPRDRSLTCLTGMHRLDTVTAGLPPKSCWLIGGDSSVGKSTFAVGVGSYNLQRGLGVLIVSSEDPIELYGRRLLQRELRLPAIKLRDGKLDAFDLERARENAAESDPWPIFLSADGVPLEDVVQWVEWAIEEHDIQLVIWDYLQEFGLRRREESHVLSTKKMGKMMRTVARTTGTAAMVLSQLTMNEKTGIPTRANIRDSRDVAHGSDVIGLLYEPPREHEDQAPGRAIFLDKVKDGPAKISIPLAWEQVSASFQEQLPRPDPEQEPEEQEEMAL